MPPKIDKKEVIDENLTAVVVVDSFDRRFDPILRKLSPWCLKKLCNVPLIHYTIAWIARTCCKNIILAVKEENFQALKETTVYKEWNQSFDQFSIIACGDAMSVGDIIRHLETTGKLTSDFLLVSNPATITRANLKREIVKFKELRKANKADNVMTLIYSLMANGNQEVIALNEENKLRLYHREDDVSRLDVSKNEFVQGLNIRSDISDTGIALCAPNIATQFSDNFDFQHTDNVIREILVNEEILLQSIHVAVLPADESSICISDYEGLLLAQTLMMEHWFYPLVPNRIPTIDGLLNVEVDKNNNYVYTIEPAKTDLATPNFPIFSGHNVCVGHKYTVGKKVVMNNVSFGNQVVIGDGTVLRDCVIGDGCKIGKNCRLVNVVVGDYATIPDNITLAEQTIIGNDVELPPDYEEIPNIAVCNVKAEEDDSMVQSEEKDGLFLWKLTTSKSFWKYEGRLVPSEDGYDYEGGTWKELPSGSDLSEEEEQEGEVDSNSVFIEEITDSMIRIKSLKFEPELMKNLILEINSSRLANNIAVDNLGKYVFYSFCGLPGNELLTNFITLMKLWKPMFSNYYKEKDFKSQFQLILGLEEKNHKDGAVFTPARCAKIIHELYKEDILEEDAILDWFETTEDEELKAAAKPIVDWLQESEEESSDEDE